jgi:TP901 family phage tail tape measure protein
MARKPHRNKSTTNILITKQKSKKMAAESKLTLLIELKNKLSAGLDNAKRQVEKSIGSIQGKLDTFGKKNAQLFDAIKENVPGVSSALGMLANPYVIATAAVVALGAAIVNCTKKAIEWREKMAEINVTAEQTPEGLKKLSDEMLLIGSRNANDLNEIPKAFSAIIGAIGDTDKSLETLEPVLRAAKAGFVDVETAARAATSIMGAAGVDGKVALDTIMATVKEGNAAFADVANYMPKIIPMARAVGLELGETAGAYAQLTKSLKPEAAATALEGVMRALSNQKVAIGEINKQTGKYVSGFRSLGVEVFDASGKIRPLVSIVKDVNTQLSGLTDKQKMLRLDRIGLDQSAATGLLSLIQNAESLNSVVNNVTDSTGQLEKAFNDAKTPMDSWRTMGNMIQVGMIKTGEVFLPIVQKIGEKILGVIHYFKDLYNRSVFLQDILKAIGLIFKVTFSVALIPIKKVINLFQNLGFIISWVWDRLKQWGVVGFFKKIYDGIRPYIIYIKDLVGGLGSMLYDFISLNFEGAYKKWKDFKMPNLDEIKSRIKVKIEGDSDDAPGNNNNNGSPVPINPNNPDEDARAIKGGSQTKNITINIGSLAKIDQYNPKSPEINNMNKAEFERWMTEMFMRVARSAEMAM